MRGFGYPVRCIYCSLMAHTTAPPALALIQTCSCRDPSRAEPIPYPPNPDPDTNSDRTPNPDPNSYPSPSPNPNPKPNPNLNPTPTRTPTPIPNPNPNPKTWAELVWRYVLEVPKTVNPSSIPGSTLNTLF